MSLLHLRMFFFASLFEIDELVLEEIFFSVVLLLFCYFLHMKKGMILHYLKLNSFCMQIHCAKFGWIDPVLLGKKTFKFCQYNFVILFLSPFVKGLSTSSEQSWTPFIQGFLCVVCLKLTNWFWRKRWKCELFTDSWMDGQTDDRTTGDQKRSLELSVQVSSKLMFWIISLKSFIESYS